jgi:crotonobetainyl-CoA:carnitine CoA-transferase CaiB-like acyl-CoA transferase
MGALDNIRVVDFGHYVAGPVVGMLLADQGADVVRVERPGGPAWPTEANATWNRGKRTITLDLTDDADRATALALAGRADIVIENFRPGVMDRLGLGEAEIRARNRGLIYNAMPAFGREDPRSAMAGWEGTVLAATDVFRPRVDYREMVQQLHRRPADREGDPLFTAEPMASLYAALLSATAIAAALRVRDETGRGQRVEVPLFDAMIQAAGIFGMAQLPFRAAFGSAVNPWDHQYRCADDRWIHIVCNHTPHAEQLAGLLDRPDLIERGLTERQLADVGAHHELILVLTEIFASRPAEAWEALLVDHELPGAMVRSTAEWLDHPQARQGGLLVDVDDPTLGPTRQPAPVVELSDPAPTAPRPAHPADADREEILQSLQGDHSIGDPDGSISPVVGPLHGIRVLDLGLVLSGPICGRVLAELGADVIKIDNPRRGGVVFHYDINRGKRSLLLDLETDDGTELFWELVDGADVIIENFRPGVVEDLAIDYELVAKEKPEIVYASITAYGERGPWSELPGYDGSIQALTGIQTRYGGSEQPTVWPYWEVDDYATGYATAYGVILALLQRSLTGRGQRVTADLARAAGLLQSAHLIDHEAKVWDEPVGPDALGLSPIQRLYRCDDGWIFLGARDAGQLEPVLGPDVDLTIDDGLADRLGRWCGERSCADAVEELVKHGLGAQHLSWLNDVMSEPVVVRRGLSVVREHGPIGLLRTNGPGPWLSRSMIDVGRPAASPGGDAAEILAELGREGDLDHLVEVGAIRLPASG